MISFIIAYSPDTAERIKNKNIVLDYYRKLMPSAEFIIEEVVAGSDFNKCKAYNAGALKASNDILGFIDIDVVVSKESLYKSIELSQNTETIVIGYNGLAIYLTYEAKKMLKDEITYEGISELLAVKDYNFNRLFKTSLFEVGNLKAVGGCLIMHKQCFEEIKGFNPNFIGWGYEDNEIVIRSHKLKKNVLYVNTNQPYLYHLPHHDVEIDKSQHTYYNKNREEYNRICSMSYDEIKHYIKSWNL